ncbi:MAG TPA: nitroreductase/quinone reductase family protein, partial [Gemmatimonadales bacterium]|nr:nitroreductase/quinone reductase family protein [Gemmatimonadales bacterium]
MQRHPGGERANPWPLNLRAHPLARVQLGAQVRTYRARAATEAELERYWPQLLRVWPAYERFYRQGGRRSVFVLDPPPRSNPNRQSSSRPESYLPRPSLLGHPAPIGRWVWLFCRDCLTWETRGWAVDRGAAAVREPGHERRCSRQWKVARMIADQEVRDALAGSFLAALPPEVVEELLANGERFDYPGGITVYRPGSPPRAAL